MVHVSVMMLKLEPIVLEGCDDEKLSELKLESVVHVGVMMLKLEPSGACECDDAKA